MDTVYEKSVINKVNRFKERGRPYERLNRSRITLTIML